VNSDPLAGWKLLGLTKLNARYDERGADVEAARVTFANFYGACCSTRKVSSISAISWRRTRGATTQAASAGPIRSTAASPTAPAAPKTASSSANLRFGQLVLQNAA